MNEFTHECLAIRVARKLKAVDVIVCPVRSLHASRGGPSHVRSDNGPELVAQAVQDWIRAVGSATAYIEPGSPWDGGGSESSPGGCFPDNGLR